MPAKLVLRVGDQTRVIEIPESGFKLGRHAETCEIAIPDGSVSGTHCWIGFADGGWCVRDNGSTNGTYVNGARVTNARLQNGDKMRFGDVTGGFLFEVVPHHPAPAPAPAAPAPAPAAESAPAHEAQDELRPGLKLPPKPGLRAGLKLPPNPWGHKKAEAAKEEAVPKTVYHPAPAAESPAAAKPVPPKQPVEKPAEKIEKKAVAKAAPEAKAASEPEKKSDWKAPELHIDKNAPVEKMSDDDVALIKELNEKYLQVKQQLSQVVIGQSGVVEEVLTAVFARGHALLMGVPGLAKTLLISTLSHVLDLGFKRVQFTPDLMPSDITGTDVLEEDKATGARQFRFVKGPIFTNMLLADEINRTPPKTQAALLEAMQEHHITVGSHTYDLPEPFFVLATQNPIEQEGTYPLPEAQMDRFMFNIIVKYPTAEEEGQIIHNVTSPHKVKLDKILDGATVLKLQDVVRRVPVAPHVIEYARNLARATRPKEPEAPDFIKELVGWGAGPRAGISLITAAKARAILHGRHHTTTGDVTAVALPVLRHRVITTFAAEAAGVTSDAVVEMLLKALKPHEDLEI